MEIEEVDDVAVSEAIDDITDDPADDETECPLGFDSFQLQRLATEPKQYESEQTDHGQDFAVTAKEAPSGSGIAHVHEIEEAWNDFDALRRIESPEGQGLDDEQLGRLIRYEYKQSQAE